MNEVDRQAEQAERTQFDKRILHLGLSLMVLTLPLFSLMCAKFCAAIMVVQCSWDWFSKSYPKPVAVLITVAVLVLVLIGFDTILALWVSGDLIRMILNRTS